MATYLGGDDTVIPTTGGEIVVSDRSKPRPPHAHKEVRPAWTCVGCGRPYPCQEGRMRLIAAHEGYTAALSMRVVELMEQALVDRPDLPLEELYERFIAWTAPPNALPER